MWGWRSKRPTGDDGAFLERRRHGRVRCDAIQTVLGEVHDISISGLRVRGRGRCVLRKDQRVGFTLRHHSGLVVLKSRVVWVRRCGFGRHEVGLELIDLTAGRQRELSKLVMAAVPAHSLQPVHGG